MQKANKILIVDDSDADRELLTEILVRSPMDYDIQMAETINDALMRIEQDRPDLILLDLYVQEKEGFELLDELRRFDNKDAIPVILVSGFTNEHDRLRGLELGATDFITKPIFPEEVRARVAVQMKIKMMNDDARWVAEETNKGIKILYGELEKKNVALKKLDQLKSDFVSTVSHELRTPLAIIRQGVSLLHRQILGPVNEQQMETLSDVLENIDRLVKIINDLLDISKLESGKVGLVKTRVDIAEFLRKIVKDFQIKAQAQGITVKSDLPESPPFVEGDKDKLIQVMTNLVGNAVKFTPPDGVVSVTAKATGDMVQISVSDTGVGIASENMPRLFDKFQQFGRVAGPGEMGTGLGLVISKEIIKLHGGEIWAESQIQQGSTFHFTVPKFENPEVKCTRTVAKTLTSLQTAAGEEGMLSVIIATVANMDGIQSSKGQEACEKVLTTLSDTISKLISRSGDVVLPYLFGRLMVILPQTDIKGAMNVCAKIRRALEPVRVSYADHVIPVDVLFGVANSAITGQDAHALIQAAEAAFIRVKKVLIVDDHPQIARLLKRHLEAEGKFECQQAFDGEEALEKINAGIPDLIICDIMMPKMNGYEFIGHLKGESRTRDIPVIILTARQVADKESHAVVPGSIPLITKTAAFEKIIEMVNKMVV